MLRNSLKDVTFAACHPEAMSLPGYNYNYSMNDNHVFGIERGQCSFYRNVKVKENVVMAISEFVTLIRNGKWRDEVTRYRQLKEEGKLAEAARIKENLPAILVAGGCEGGHTKANFRWFSGEAMVDVDHGENLPAMLSLLKEQPWVRAGWVSVSGNGIKVVADVMAETQEEYEQYAYPALTDRVSRLIGMPVDMQCKDLTRMCFVSWDEDAFWKDECEVFPWREEMERLKAASENPVGTEGESSKNPHSIEENPSLEGTSEARSKAEGLVPGFYRRFCRTHTFAPGSRHDFLLKLGASARRNGMNSEELDLLISLAEQTLSAPDYKAGEIRRNITDSYRFTDNNPREEGAASGFRVQGDPSTPSRRPQQRDGYSGWSTEQEAEVEEEKKEQNLKLRLEAPYLPDWIFESLPSLLTTGLRTAKNKRQRDMLLLAMLTNLSACMPNVKMRYDDDYIYPHLFLAVIASSASGKGIMTNASKLSRVIQKELDKENAEQQKEYDNAMLAWEVEHNNALREKRKPDLDSRPEPPLRKTLAVPADMSRSQLIRLLAGSPDGILLNTSELDTLRSAVNAEYGRFDDLMRACFHHEMFGSDFKNDKRPYIVYSPKMAFCGSGTPSQFYRLCPSLENGAYSRYLIYLAEQNVEFMSMAPRGEGENKEKIFRELGEEVHRMYRYLKGYPTEITFTPEQWDLHKSFFQGLLQGVKMEEVEGPFSVIFRYGMMAARLAMIFTALRKYEAQWCFRDISCTDDDFLLSLAIIEVLTSHSLMFATSLHKVKQAPTEMRKYFRVRQALEKLKSEFTFTEFVSAFVSEGFSEATAKRYRIRLIDLNIIEKQGDSYRFAHRRWRAKLELTPLGKV